MSDLWLPGAVRLRSSHSGGTLVGGPPRVVWHRTAGGTFASNGAFLPQEGFEPHLLWDPHTGEIGQFLPADTSGYALMHPAGGIDTNRMGSRCIQIEVVDRGQTWLVTDTPMVGWDGMRRWLAGHGIPERWPGGPPPPLGSRSTVPDEVWRTQAGHYSHSQVPGNTHVDPGSMDPRRMFTSEEEPVTDADIEKVAQRVVDLLRPWVATHQDMRTLLRGDETHPASLTSIARKVGVEGVQ